MFSSFQQASRRSGRGSFKALSALSSNGGATAVAQQKRGMALTYKAPLRDVRFLLNDVFDIEKHYNKVGFPDVADPAVCESILEEVAKFSEEKLFPISQVGDEESCEILPDGNIRTPTGWKAAYEEWSQAGWQSMSVPEEYGGQGMPLSLNLMKAEITATANWTWSMYPGLSIGAMNTLMLHASEEQKHKYLTKLGEGTWSGTMCLTEPQCGTDLSQVRTKAVPQPDGSYKISGTKIFISCGDHDFTENIIHIVLARIEGAPEGTRGISLFIVPKFLENEDGTLKSEKNIVCGGLEKKQGIKGSTTCVMNFDDSVGYLMGAPNQGLKQMFTFMNTARLGTGLQGLAATELSYQGALDYARERLAMRSLTGPKFPDKVADPIIVHPDVRRMLLTQKAIAEGGRALCFYSSFIGDEMFHAKSEEQFKKADNYLGLFTPIVKAFLTEIGYECTNHGMTVYGGHGYIREWGMEQIVRDTRISTLYEGTTGVQALDLLGRKVLLGKGQTLLKFTKEIFGFTKDIIVSHPDKVKLLPYALKVAGYTAKWLALTGIVTVGAARDKEMVGSASVDYLMYGGYTTVAYMWLKMMAAAHTKLAENPSDAAFYKTKIQTGEFYFDRLLPRADSHFTMARKNPRSIMQIDAEDFDLATK